MGFVPLGFVWGGEGSGRGEKFAGAPLPPKKSNLTYTRCCARGGNWLICIARNVQTYEGSRSNSHGLENPLTRWWVSFSGSGELVQR